MILTQALTKLHREIKSGKSAEELRSEVYMMIDCLEDDSEDLDLEQFCTLVRQAR